jgi:hypothetical protein
MMMSLHPEIIQMRINSAGLSDELMSQNTSYPILNWKITDSMWVHSKIDSTLRIAWIKATDTTIHVFALQKNFQVQKIPFILTIIADAKQFHDFLSDQPFGKDYSMSIYSASGIILQDTLSFKPGRPYVTMEKSNSVQSVQERSSSWRVLTSTFQSAQLWMNVAVPEKTLLKPVEDFLFYSSFIIIGLMFIISILGWWVSHQMKKFIEKMKIFYSTSNS